MNEITDSLGRATDPYGEGYEPPAAPGPFPRRAADVGATGLLDFPPLPPYPDLAAYPDADAGAHPAAPYLPFPQPEGPADYSPAADTTPGGDARPPTPDPGGLRVASEANATARLWIKLPDTVPQPSTSLRPQAAWEDTAGAQAAAAEAAVRDPGSQAAPFARVAASPARPTALPAELAALATATMVVPLPADARPTSALLTTTLPPDKAAQANAAQLTGSFHDSLEQAFGIDFDGVSAADGTLGRHEDPVSAHDDLLPEWFRTPPERGTEAAQPVDFDAFGGRDQAPYAYVPGAVPSAAFGGPYGVPTQPAAFPGFAAYGSSGQEAARHALALRYLGGIFHDSSGESSYLDPGSIGLALLRHRAAAGAPTEQIPRVPAQAPAKPPAAAKPRSTAAAPRNASADQRAAHTAPGKHAGALQSTPERADGSWLPVFAGLCVAAFAILYGVALIVVGGVFGGTVPAGASVGGVQIGGLSPAAAERAVQAHLRALAQSPVRLYVGQTPMSLEPARSGLSIDAVRSVQDAEGGRTNPFAIIPALFGGHRDVAPVTAVDGAALDKSLNALAARFGIPMVEGRITFHSAVPVVTAPRAGRGFSVDGAAAAISSGYLRVDGPIVLPVQTLYPKATPASLQKALEDIARPAVAAPITLVTGNVAIQLTAAKVGDALVIAPDAVGRLTPTADGVQLRADLNPSVLSLEQPAVNASFAVADGKPVLVPGHTGRGFSADSLSAAVLSVLTDPAPRSSAVPIGELQPAFSTAQARALGVTDVLASNTLAVPPVANRVQNARRAAALVNGSVVQPGQTWSFLKTVGQLTTADGFTPSSPSQRAGVDPSGGVDTVATDVFDAAFAAGMGDTIHHPHASYVDRYPVGLDAAVVAPGTDLQWTDTSATPVYVYASSTGGTLTVALLGQQTYDKVAVQVSQRYAITATPPPHSGCMNQRTMSGFQVDVTRTLMRGGAQVGTEQYHVTYAPTGGQSCATTSSPPPTGSTGGASTGPATGATTPPATPPSSSAPPGLIGGLLH